MHGCVPLLPRLVATMSPVKIVFTGYCCFTALTWCPKLGHRHTLFGWATGASIAVERACVPASRHGLQLITTYEVANLEKRSLQNIAWRYLIIDEAHR